MRSGAKFSMPGMMETVLNIGLNDESVQGLAKQTGNERFAWDSYRRLIQMFGKTVLDIDGEHFEDALDEAKKAKGTRERPRPRRRPTCAALVDTFKEHRPRARRPRLPERPARADGPRRPRGLRLVERAARDPLPPPGAHPGRPRHRGQRHVDGVRQPRHGLRHRRRVHPRPGLAAQQGIYGDYLQNAQGEDVVAGIRNTLPLQDLEGIDKPAYDELLEIMETLENHYRDLCDIEFTIERGKLWMLQTRVGKRTAGAAFRIATQLVDQGLIDLDEALQPGHRRPAGPADVPAVRRERRPQEQIAKGMNASPGAAVGKAVFDSDTRRRSGRAPGEKVILVRRETNPDDLDGMIAAQGILTSRGGKTVHAAVVARGMGKTCVCGAEELEVDLKGRQFTAPGGAVVNEGDVISIDGTTGEVYLGEVPVVASPVVRVLRGQPRPGDSTDADDLVKAVHRLMTHADDAPPAAACGPTPTPPRTPSGPAASAPRASGCAAPSTCSSATGASSSSDLILADGDDEREAALDALLPLQREDFVGIFEAMDGLPVTVRLLDPPLHEFLPDLTELSVKVAVAEARGEDARERAAAARRPCTGCTSRTRCSGLRGVRLGLVVPGLFAMQVRAIAEAAAERKKAGGDPHAEIMVPLVGAVQELEMIREEAEQILRRGVRARRASRSRT